MPCPAAMLVFLRFLVIYPYTTVSHFGNHVLGLSRNEEILHIDLINAVWASISPVAF
ncbi:hypothetical protein M758_6G145900 [Ceratodon purpureus]|nr:hypothetical protein M758_6G145900 [Ceratodon purpureus]